MVKFFSVYGPSLEVRHLPDYVLPPGIEPIRKRANSFVKSSRRIGHFSLLMISDKMITEQIILCRLLTSIQFFSSLPTSIGQKSILSKNVLESQKASIFIYHFIGLLPSQR
ncbi:Uncharacterised protein at_DN1008 [Pycnogonum litorale]